MSLNNVNFNNFQTQVLPNTTVQRQNTDLISKTKPDEFVSQNKPVEEDSTQKKKSVLKKAAVIGGAIAGIAAAAIFLYRKDKTSGIKHLAPNIEFKKAETVEEAIQWGKKTLGIQTYSGFETKDIDVLNWINEGFTNVSNAMQGNLRMPKRVVYTSELGSDTLAGVVPYTSKLKTERGFFGVNKDIFSDIDKAIKEIVQSYIDNNKCLAKTQDGGYKTVSHFLDTEYATKMIEELKAFENGSLTDFNNKISLYGTLCRFQDLPAIILQSPFIKIKQITEMLEKQGFKVEINLNGIKQKPIEEQKHTLARLIKLARENAKRNVTFYTPKQGPFTTIYHEMGHLQDMGQRVMPTDYFDSPDKYPEELKKWLDNALDIQAANSVSPYAATGPGEFIAETFAKIMDYGTVSDDAMQLYSKLNGPKIPS